MRPGVSGTRAIIPGLAPDPMAERHELPGTGRLPRKRADVQRLSTLAMGVRWMLHVTTVRTLAQSGKSAFKPEGVLSAWRTGYDGRV